MQVDNRNIKQILPTILQKIQQSDFISFDCQFTGLVTKLQRIQGLYPNHIQFYQRIKQTAYNFSIIQLGIATFTYKDGIYKPNVYNIYISPITYVKGYNNVMICQVESMEFLAQNKLDFNRVFCQGIKPKRLYSNDIQQKHQYNEFSYFNIDNLFLSPQEEQIVNFIQNNIVKEIIGNCKLQRIVDFQNKTLFAYFRHKYSDMMFDKSKKNMKRFQYAVRFRQNILKQNNQIKKQQAQIEKQKKMIDQVEQKMQKGQKMEEEQIKQKQLKEKKQKQTIIQQKKQQTKPQIQPQLSLAKIFQVLINGKKPIVGHFPNLDLGLIYHTFLCDLPQTYQQFCHTITNFFPYIFDTKVLSRRLQSRLKGLKVDLPSLFKACCNPKLLKPYSNFDITGLQEYVQKQHQAGYDAFITGCSFIGMTNYLTGHSGRINLLSIQQQNMLLYSRFSGQVSINGNGYASNSMNYTKCIIIQPILKQLYPQWKNVAKMLSKFGSLIVNQDHGEIYYVFQQPQNILQIISYCPNLGLRCYQQRRIIRARNMYNILNV